MEEKIAPKIFGRAFFFNMPPKEMYTSKRRLLRRNGQFWAKWSAYGRKGRLRGEMGMIIKVIGYNPSAPFEPGELYFCRIACFLNSLSKLTIGSDDEYAMKASFKRCFPQSTHVLCTRHLRKNANDYLEDTAGFPMKERSRVLGAIFGENGLTSFTDVDTFHKRLERIHNDLLARELPSSEKTFRQYLDQRLVPLIQNHVVDPILKGNVQRNRSSSNCESTNHILKSATHWRQKSMPDLILQMHSKITAEQEEVSRAVRDTGNYKSHKLFQHHRVSIDTWADLEAEKR